MSDKLQLTQAELDALIAKAVQEAKQANVKPRELKLNAWQSDNGAKFVEVFGLSRNGKIRHMLLTENNRETLKGYLEQPFEELFEQGLQEQSEYRESHPLKPRYHGRR